MFDEKSHSLKMDKAIEVFSKELSSLRTGRANSAMLDLIKETILGAKKAAPAIEIKKDTEKKEKVDKSKTIAETDREKLEKRFSKKKPEKLN